MFKLREDPRVTPMGQRLRARHLDELPSSGTFCAAR